MLNDAVAVKAGGERSGLITGARGRWRRWWLGHEIGVRIRILEHVLAQGRSRRLAVVVLALLAGPGCSMLPQLGAAAVVGSHIHGVAHTYRGSGSDATQGEQAIVAAHLVFDDRRFDHVTAGQMLIDCANDAACDAHTSPAILGMMAGYLRRVDPAAADRELAAAGRSGSERSAFNARLATARKTIAHRLQELDPRRQALWADLPEQVWRERAAYFRRWSALYAQLDPLLTVAESGEGDLAGTVRGIRALRGRYLGACKADGCLFSPFVLDATRALELLAVRMKDVPSALAEHQLLGDERLVSQYLSRAILTVQLPAAEREAEQWTKYHQAEQAGADPASLQAMFGATPPVQVSPDSPWEIWGRRSIPDLTTALDQSGFENATGNVIDVSRHGATATISFADAVTTYTDEDCHETDKVDGIRADGTLSYRRECRDGATHVEHDRVPPIVVPVEQAAALHHGDLVMAWVAVHGRRGEIAFVQTRDEIVQVRGARLRVKERSREQRSQI